MVKPTTAAPPASDDDVRRGTASQVAQVLELTNQERAKAGCEPVAIESHLARAAGDFALYLATYDYVGHETKDGIELGDRVTPPATSGEASARTRPEVFGTPSPSCPRGWRVRGTGKTC